jgi:carbon storage regulator CsrA
MAGMLCLTRKCGERIMIDGGIIIEVLEMANGRVRLGISAPRHVKVLRGELEHRGKGEASAEDNDTTTGSEASGERPATAETEP